MRRDVKGYIRYIVAAVIAIVVVVGIVVGAIALAGVLVAVLAYENSTFITVSGGPRPAGESLALPDHKKPAKPAHVADEVARAAVAKAGVSGRLLGTYIYNATHYVTLVDKGPLSAYAVIWNNETAAAVRLNFTKYIERSFKETVGEHGEYKLVRGGRYVGYVETSGILPFSLYKFYDEAWDIWRSAIGTYEMAAAGWFTVVYGASVHVTDASYDKATGPLLRSCYFNSYTQGDGTPQAGVRAIGRAITLTCPVLGTVFEIMATIAYNAWVDRFAATHGDKWFTIGCVC